MLQSLQSECDNLPKITIITPSFNQGQYIEETIRSVLLQNYPNLEYIIIDGGSTDNTVYILKKYQQYITYLVSEPDNGQSHAINKGLENATGEIFGWLNSDDYYLPNVLLTVGKLFAKNKEMNVLCGCERHLYQNGQIVRRKKWTTPIYKSVEKMLAHNHIVQPPTFFRLNIIKNLGLLQENLHFCMDADIWVRYLALFGKKGIFSTPTIFNIFRYHNISKSVKQRELYLTDRYNILQCLLESCKINDFSKINFHNSIYLNRYLLIKYDFNKNINESKLKAFIAVRIILFFKKHLTWQSFGFLYLYVLRTKTFGHSWLFYFSAILKIRQHLLLLMKQE